MKKALCLLLATCMIFTAAGCGKSEAPAASGGTASQPAASAPAAPGGDKAVMRIGIGLNDQHPQYLGLLKFKEEVEKNTGGRFEVQVNHSSTVGDDRAMLEMLQMGTLDGTCPSSAVVANFAPEFTLYDFPFLFTTLEEVDAILDGEKGREILDLLEPAGIIGMNYWELGFLNITNSKRPVTKVKDLNGLKIRTMENQLQLDTLRALGANPTPMAFSELFTAMQQGTVDGQQNPEASIYSMKFYEVQKYMTLTRHVYQPFVFCISKKFWDKLSDEDKAIFQAAADAGRDEERRIIREESVELQQKLAELGMQVDEMAEGEVERMKELVQPVIDTHAEKIGKELVDEMYAAVAALH
ncbi:TRAP transporter substrate-binding protein [Anaerotruncus rubiinfantis]|uniref:TRAP transporter substrate-binding protein n=1 Tax=Anaerotruncus rubiinfantis TaxID=1720200 RepID=UPI00189B39B6|nr:TRAP transporter substrate-binding protein [Anaerotruncus rubiinfantis]